MEGPLKTRYSTYITKNTKLFTMNTLANLKNYYFLAKSMLFYLVNFIYLKIQGI